MFLLGGQPDAEALVCGEQRWSYRRLQDEVERFAATLPPGPQLGFVRCSNDLDTVRTLLAALHARHPVALVDAAMPAEPFAGLVAGYRPDWISGPLLDEPLRRDYHRVGELWRRTSASEAPLHPELAMLLPTSGSTGSPKMVRLTASALRANATAIASALALTADERAITSLPLSYSYGLSLLTSHLVSGASIVLSGHGLTDEEFWRSIRIHRCTSFAGVPYSYQIVRRLDLDKLDVPSITTLTQAGGKLDPRLIAHFHQVMERRGGRIFVMYGQTEATARISVLPPERVGAKVGSVGLAIPGMQLSVENDGVVAPPGQTGEIMVRGTSVMMGYAAGREDLPRGDELGGVLATGDLGHLDDQGFLFVTGRSRRIAKVFGLRLNLDEVEVLVREELAEVAAVAGNDTVVVYCVGSDDTQLHVLRHKLAARLKLHPSGLVFRAIDMLPRSAGGKIDYARLPAP